MRLGRAMHCVDGYGHVLRRFSDFLLVSPFFNSSGSVLAKKTGSFSRNWPLARAKFDAVFLNDF
jgi:hypothetical protein